MWKCFKNTNLILILNVFLHLSVLINNSKKTKIVYWIHFIPRWANYPIWTDGLDLKGQIGAGQAFAGLRDRKTDPLIRWSNRSFIASAAAVLLQEVDIFEIRFFAFPLDDVTSGLGCGRVAYQPTEKSDLKLMKYKL